MDLQNHFKVFKLSKNNFPDVKQTFVVPKSII